MRRQLMAAAVVAGCLTLGYGGAARAAPRVTSETATSGSVQATVSYVLLPRRVRYYVRLAVERDGRRIYDERVPSVSRPGAWNQPIGVWRTQGLRSARTITLRDLDGDGEPEILLEFWYGGAHCCFWTRIYRWDESRRSYVNTAHVWGNVDYRLADLHRAGRLELVTADDRFAYAFTSFAGSGFPIQIWDYREGRLVNTTRAYQDAIARDAARQWRWYGQARRRGWEVRGLLAAWAADECLLGRGPTALAWLQRHQFVLSAPDEQSSGSPRAYLKSLRVFLHGTGYLP
jgi:hypothetical protein